LPVAATAFNGVRHRLLRRAADLDESVSWYQEAALLRRVNSPLAFSPRRPIICPLWAALPHWRRS
jgi:hypothetical protein